MRRWTKISLTSLFVLCAAIIAGTVTLKLVLTTDNIKTFMVKQVKESTGRDLTIQGDIAWRLFPRLSLQINDLIITNPAIVKEQISATQINIGVKILPLIKQRIEPTAFVISHFHYQDKEDHHLNIGRINLAGSAVGLGQQFPLQIAINNIQGVFDGDIHLTGTGYINQKASTIKLKNYQATINDSTITGDIEISGLQNNLDDFIAGLEATGTANIDHINSPKLNIQDLQATINMHEGIANLNVSTAKLYQGSLHGKVRVNLRTSTTHYQAEAAMLNVDMQPLLHNALGTAYLSGKTDLQLALTSEGNDQQTMIKHLDGTIALHVDKGQLLNLGHSALAQQAAAVLHRDVNVSEDFNSINSNATINKGVVKITFAIDAPNMRAKGNGQVNLNKQHLNIDLVARYLQSRQTRDYQIPINFSGQFNNIAVSIDANNLLKQTIANHSNKISDKAKKYGIDLNSIFK